MNSIAKGLRMLPLFLSLAFAPGASPDRAVPPAPRHDSRIVLTPLQGGMTATAKVPLLGDQTFSLGIPETIGSREKMILNFPEVTDKIVWSGPDSDGAVATEWSKDGVIHYYTRLIPSDDHVDVEMTISNLTASQTWHDVFAFNCLNPGGAPDFKDWELERTYMSVHGAPLLMNKTTRVHGQMPTVGFYSHEQIPWGLESPFVRGFAATSPDRADDSWMITLSEDPPAYMAATALDAVFLFDNLDRCCLHSAPNFGEIGPGQRSSTVARLYLAKGGLEDFLKRYRSDRVALAAGQKWARPRAPRLELEGVEPPAPGKFGRLGFRVKAPWMKGHIEQRFPETLHSSLGLHFIDHDRKDMPPLSMLDPFPQWKKDDATGEISYSHTDGAGLEFGGRARPYEDEVFMECRVRNTTDQTIRNVSAQMCTSLADSPDFDPKKEVTRTFAWIDGAWTAFADTTPNKATETRHPWIIIPVKGVEYRGPRDNPDGWWVAEQTADVGVAARTTQDEAHLAALRWDDAPMVASNSKIPCLHAGPSGGATLEPGQEIVWRGKIYLVKNDPQALQTRCKGDSGAWPYETPKPDSVTQGPGESRRPARDRARGQTQRRE